MKPTPVKRTLLQRWRGAWRRWSLWTALVLLVVSMLVTMVWLAGRYEASQVQSRLERDAADAGSDIRSALSRNVQSLQALQAGDPGLLAWEVNAAELLRQRNIYHQLNQEAHTAIEACGGSAQGQSTMAKLNTKMGIGLKTLTDKSTRNLAEMLSEGSSQGVMDCIKSQKDYPDAAPGSKRLMQKLQDLEEENRLKLEQFL